MKWSEDKKYKYWKASKYNVDDMTTDERRWFEKMERKYNPPQKLTKVKNPFKAKNIMGGKRGRKTLDSLFGI